MEGELVVARCAIFPKFITDGVFSAEALLAFGAEYKETDGRYHTAISVGDRSQLTTDESVHSYGCRTAAFGNKRKREKFSEKKKEFDEAADRVFYIGFYNMSAREIVEISYVSASFSLVSVEENGEKAHAEIRMIQVPPATRREFLDMRLEAYAALARMLVGPIRHVCDIDESFREMLENIELPEVGKPPNLSHSQSIAPGIGVAPGP